MAQAPKCSICGVAHWSREPHRFAEPKEASPAFKAEFQAEVARKMKSLADYQREEAEKKAKAATYMRAYRARRNNRQ